MHYSFFFLGTECSDFYVTHLYSLSVVQQLFVSGQMSIFSHFCHHTSVIICAFADTMFAVYWAEWNKLCET